MKCKITLGVLLLAGLTALIGGCNPEEFLAPRDTDPAEHHRPPTASETPEKNPATATVQGQPTEIRFFNSEVFDRELSEALARNRPRVTVRTGGSFTVDTVPERMDQWLVAADRAERDIRLLPDPNDRSGRGVRPSSGRRWDDDPDRSRGLFGRKKSKDLYRPVENYNLRVLYRRDSGAVTQVVFHHKDLPPPPLPEPVPPEPEAEPEEVEAEEEPIEQMVLTLTASDQLNVFDDKPHAVSLCVYQLAGPGAFSTRGRTAEGLAELLSCKMLDATVLSYDRLFVQPSQSERKVISRTAGAEYIGIVAGYYEASAGATTVLTRFDNTAARLNLAADGIRLRKTGRSAAKK